MSLVLKSQLSCLCVGYLPMPRLIFLTCNTQVVRLHGGLNEMEHAVLAEELAHKSAQVMLPVFLSSLIAIGK